MNTSGVRRKALLGLAAIGVVAACSTPVAAFAYGQGSTDPTTSVSTDPGFQGSVPPDGGGGGDSLPLTGGDIASAAVIGLAVAGTGVALAASKKRRAANA